MWVKDETGNVSGSHKARHLFGVLLQLEIAERLCWADPLERPAARDRELRERRARGGRPRRGSRPRADACSSRSTPTPPSPRGSRRSGRRSSACPREPGATGDPTYDALLRGARGRRAAVHLPGKPERPRRRGRDDARVRARLRPRAEGGPSTASSCRSAAARSRARASSGWREARALGALRCLPRIDTVQTAGRRAARARVRRLVARPAALRRTPRRHRAEFMWPWETEPHSVAHGILDDETYDWLAVVRGDARDRRRAARRRRGDARARQRARARDDRHRRRPHRLVRARRPASRCAPRARSAPTSASPSSSRA